jgi:hypothetical protein
MRLPFSFEGIATYIHSPCLDIKKQSRRILERLFHCLQAEHGFAAADDAVAEANGSVSDEVSVQHRTQVANR